MALIHCDFFSEAIGLSSSMYVILPQATQTQIGMEGTSSRDKHPTLYLLHGLSDDHSIWLRRTSIERYVAPLGLAVVMPAVHRSFYTDMRHGYRYWAFISEELPALARSFFPLSDAREDNFVAGLSMGGYGAFKMALRKPDAFAACASLSGALDMTGSFDNPDENWRREMQGIFGSKEDFAGSDDDVMGLAEKVARSDGPKPKLHQCCGTEDFLYQGNVRFRDHAQKLGLDLTYEEGPGQHEWGYWDAMIQKVLAWLPLNDVS
jgi:putative tributyrin esterase